MSKTIVVTSGKGGVGKSTVTAYLGTELCELGKRVLLIDMDEGLRSLDLILGVSANTVFDVYDVICGNCTPSQAILQISDLHGLYLLPAPVKKGMINDPHHVKELCGCYSDMFDYIIIDSPAGIGDGFYLSAAAADMALVVVTPDPVSVRAGATAASLLRECTVNNIRLVINKLNTPLMRKGTFHNIDEIIDITQTQLIAAIPTDYAVTENSSKGLPLPTSYAKDSFVRLAGRLTGQRIMLPKLQKFT